MKQRILNAADSPRDLEILYRENPDEFTRAFAEAYSERGDSVILNVWRERLFFTDAAEAAPREAGWRSRDIWIVVLLSAIAGTLAKLPQFFPSTFTIDDVFYARNLGGIVIGALIACIFILKPCRLRVVVTVCGLLCGSLIVLNLLPEIRHSQTVTLSCMHMPFFFWSLLGVAFVGDHWRDLRRRMDYIRYNGELLIYTTIILIGGMALTGLTLALFSLINAEIEKWYLSNVVVYGSIAAPIVATLLIERITGTRFRIAPILAKIFTPLFLGTVIVYMAVMILGHNSPYTDREFLIVFNGLLLFVLGMSVLSISERGSTETVSIADLMSIGLVLVTLAVDVIALSAILFRLTTYGFTPNRLAVLGANLLAFVHLSGIVWHYQRFLRRKSGFDGLDHWIVRYLPVYTAWTVVVGFGFPFFFWFQ